MYGTGWAGAPVCHVYSEFLTFLFSRNRTAVMLALLFLHAFFMSFYYKTTRIALLFGPFRLAKQAVLPCNMGRFALQYGPFRNVEGLLLCLCKTEVL